MGRFDSYYCPIIFAKNPLLVWVMTGTCIAGYITVVVSSKGMTLPASPNTRLCLMHGLFFIEVITVPIYKRCDRCGKRLPAGTKCKCSKKRYKHEKIYIDDKIESFYLSKEWRKKREYMIDVYHQLDIYDLYINDVISYGRIMHHIVPLKDDWNKRLEDTNLIYLTDSNHQALHDLMRKSEEDKKRVVSILRDLVLRFRKEMGIGGT